MGTGQIAFEIKIHVLDKNCCGPECDWYDEKIDSDGHCTLFKTRLHTKTVKCPTCNTAHTILQRAEACIEKEVIIYCFANR